MVVERHEALVKLVDVLLPVWGELHRRHHQVELPHAPEVVHNRGPDGRPQLLPELTDEGLLQDPANAGSSETPALSL